MRNDTDTKRMKNVILRGSNCSMISGDRLQVLYDYAEETKSLGGVNVECGVCNGGSAYIIYEASDHVPIHLFDTFNGHPPEAIDGSCKEAIGGCKTKMESFKHMMELVPIREEHKGTMPWSFYGFKHEVNMLHIDVDTYFSTRAVLEYFYPLMKHGGVMICDDYGFDNYANAAKRAVDEYFKYRPQKAVLLPTHQCVIQF